MQESCPPPGPPPALYSREGWSVDIYTGSRDKKELRCATSSVESGPGHGYRRGDRRSAPTRDLTSSAGGQPGGLSRCVPDRMPDHTHAKIFLAEQLE